ncbi:nitrite reductase [Paradesulfitobacterium ferrireducens]|uniref:nitrite reductase n=1 Tax=Paradesulfitobacterium ferrireducens TaxID=2816476 RepID=UPI001A8DD522|nr:nitrite reductase [Paradesulfitobacterium ferrireducens]
MTKLVQDSRFSWTGEVVSCSSGITWGIAEQANGLMAILLNVPGGILTGRQVKVMGEIVGDDGIIKNSRRMAPILLIPKERVASALIQLEEASLRPACLNGSVRNIVSCPGKGFSKNSRGDTLELAQALDAEFYGTVLPWDFKIGISGCPRNCSGVQCHDIGLMAEPRGKFSLWIGGTESGMNPRHGSLIRKGVTRAQVPVAVRRILELYAEGAEEYREELGKRIRLYHVLDKTGMERFEQAVAKVLAE